MRAEFSDVVFDDRVKAEGNLARIEQRLDASLVAPLPSLLGQSPDPDGALNLLERYTEIASPETLHDIARYPTALTYLVAIFGYSGSLAEALLADPPVAAQFARDRNFTKLKSVEDLMQDFARFSTTSPDHWLSAQIARFKRRNYLRLVLKDVLRLSTLAETTLELSSLADVILTNALIYCDQELKKRYGQPQYRDVQGRLVRSTFSVISLGKLGGNELNYSSDIDLLFLYSNDGETSGGSEPDSVISNKEYFVRLAHAITRTITQTTPQGQVFRVDLRLRPEGDQGDLTIALRSALEYYEHRARDWELQMLIKARHSAGDARLTRDFLRNVESYVYGTAADFEAVESVLWTRERISKRLVENRSETIDVKRHRGGIRDIEFLTQCLQRLYGGREKWVRSGGTLHALRKLNDKGKLSDRDYAALTSAYEFLRKVEHRIQLDLGQQTHRLPVSAEALDRLARRVGAEPSSGRPGEALVHRIERAFAQVGEIYQRVIHPGAAKVAEGDFELKAPSFASAQGPHSHEAVLGFLEAQAPELARVLRAVPLPDRARPLAARFFSALLASSERFDAARRDPERVRRALEVLGSSEYFAEIVIHHPEDLAALDATVPSAAPESQLAILLSDEARDNRPADRFESAVFPWVNERGFDLREKLAALRREFRCGTLALGSRDCAGFDSIFASLARWSALAERSVASAFAIAVESLRAPTRSPLRPGGGGADDAPFAILALGRLGMKEFDLASDADLVFIEAGDRSRRSADSTHRECGARIAERAIEALSSYTQDGTVFVVDTRLRPRGQEGELVVSEDALLRYLSEEALPWEALTYLKARVVAGNKELGARVVARLPDRLFSRFSAHPDLAGELQEMRRRLERELEAKPSDTKTAPGGYYDIDFAVSCLRLLHRVELAPGATMPQQIAALAAKGLLSGEDAAALAKGAVFLRTVDHAIRLVTGKAARGLPEHVGHADAVTALARAWGLVGSESSLADDLRAVQQRVRSVYRRMLGAE